MKLVNRRKLGECMDHSTAYAADGIDLDRVRSALGRTTPPVYANATVFVEARSPDPMAARLKEVLREQARAQGALRQQDPGKR